MVFLCQKNEIEQSIKSDIPAKNCHHHKSEKTAIAVQLFAQQPHRLRLTCDQFHQFFLHKPEWQIGNMRQSQPKKLPKRNIAIIAKFADLQNIQQQKTTKSQKQQSQTFLALF